MMRRAVAALVVLWLPFVPAANPWDNRLFADPRPPAIMLVVLALLAALALARRRLGWPARLALAVVIVAAAALQLASALVEIFLDRALDLSFDLGHVPSLVGLFVAAEGGGRAMLAAGVALVGLGALLAAVTWALGAWQMALAVPRRAGRRSPWRWLRSASARCRGARTGAAASPSPRSTMPPTRPSVLWRVAAVTTGIDRHTAALLDAAEPAGDLAALAGRDVFLVFVESYGTAVLDDPRFRDQALPALEQFARSVGAAGYGMASSRLTSPVFGAGSEVAHGTLASGVKLDPFLYRLVTESRREPLAGYFRAAGHRTVAVMPGIRQPWPESAYWGFERGYFAADLGYRGPSFGWFAIPDQYTLARLDEAELGPGHAPLFAEIVLVSSHTPFAPVPPYVADWSDSGRFASIAAGDWPRIMRAPDWQHLEAPYLESIDYDLRTLAAWLGQLSGNGLVIILGDHQPPGIANGATAPWTVPVHVLSRDPALLAPFVRQGYVAGAMPPAGRRLRGWKPSSPIFSRDSRGTVESSDDRRDRRCAGAVPHRGLRGGARLVRARRGRGDGRRVRPALGARHGASRQFSPRQSVLPPGDRPAPRPDPAPGAMAGLCRSGARGGAARPALAQAAGAADRD